MIKNIVFDFDGTLVDTAPLIVSTMQATIGELGLQPRTDAECRKTIGLRLEDIPGVLWPEKQNLSKIFTDTYRRIFNDLKRPLNVNCYPGVTETLRVLHESGFRLAIASSRSHRSLAEYVDEFDIARLFSALVGGDDVACGKPSPEPVLHILGQHNLEASETLVVGDAVFDIEMGKNAGAATCAVTYGNQSREQLETSRPDFIVSSFPAVLPIAMGVDPELVEYVESEILPRYSSFDKAHRKDHARMVIGQSMLLSAKLPELNRDMVYVVAAFHDTGLEYGREKHHIFSGKILSEDNVIKRMFSDGEIEMMRQAVEDHRASNGSEPRNDYGLIVAEADRFIDPETIVRRTVQYGLANYPDIDRDGQFKRALGHLTEKYGPEGYLKIWFPWSGNARRLRQLHAIIKDKEAVRDMFDRIYKEEIAE